MRVKCPACGVVVQCDPGPSGKRVACPACQKVFSVRPPSEAVTATPVPRREEEILDVLPADAEPSGPTRAAHLFARQEGIDPHETFDRRVADEAEADTLLNEWRQEMPEASSAYQPSGALPAGALMLMVAGSVVGAVAGLLAGGAVAAVGGALIALIAYLVALMAFCGVVWCIVPILGGIVALVVAIGTFAAAGGVSAWCTTSFGRLGKNRNVRAAVLLSVLSSVLAIGIALILYYTVGKPLLVEHDMARFSDLIALVTAAIGGVIAAFMAGGVAGDSVRGAKFCESCECYMTATSLKTLGLGSLRTLVRALGQNRLDVAGSLLHGPDGEDGDVKLFSCPSCSRGYLEATAKYKAEWKVKKDTKDKEQSWLVASRELSEAERDQVRPPGAEGA